MKLEPQMAAAYSNPADATARVDQLATQGVDGIKACAGIPAAPERSSKRLDPEMSSTL